MNEPIGETAALQRRLRSAAKFNINRGSGLTAMALDEAADALFNLESDHAGMVAAVQDVLLDLRMSAEPDWPRQRVLPGIVEHLRAALDEGTEPGRDPIREAQAEAFYRGVNALHEVVVARVIDCFYDEHAERPGVDPEDFRDMAREHFAALQTPSLQSVSSSSTKDAQSYGHPDQSDRTVEPGREEAQTDYSSAEVLSRRGARELLSRRAGLLPQPEVIEPKVAQSYDHADQNDLLILWRDNPRRASAPDPDHPDSPDNDIGRYIG